MATQSQVQNTNANRVVLIAVDGSHNSENAFQCEFLYIFINIFKQDKNVEWVNLNILVLDLLRNFWTS